MEGVRVVMLMLLMEKGSGWRLDDGCFPYHIAYLI